MLQWKLHGNAGLVGLHTLCLPNTHKYSETWKLEIIHGTGGKMYKQEANFKNLFSSLWIAFACWFIFFKKMSSFLDKNQVIAWLLIDLHLLWCLKQTLTIYHLPKNLTKQTFSWRGWWTCDVLSLKAYLHSKSTSFKQSSWHSCLDPTCSVLLIYKRVKLMWKLIRLSWLWYLSVQGMIHNSFKTPCGIAARGWWKTILLYVNCENWILGLG